MSALALRVSAGVVIACLFACGIQAASAQGRGQGKGTGGHQGAGGGNPGASRAGRGRSGDVNNGQSRSDNEGPVLGAESQTIRVEMTPPGVTAGEATAGAGAAIIPMRTTPTRKIQTGATGRRSRPAAVPPSRLGRRAGKVGRRRGPASAEGRAAILIIPARGSRRATDISLAKASTAVTRAAVTRGVRGRRAAPLRVVAPPAAQAGVGIRDTATRRVGRAGGQTHTEFARPLFCRDR